MKHEIRKGNKEMTKSEMKEKLKELCEESYDLYCAFKSVKGMDNMMTQEYFTKWETYEDLYKEFFGEE